MQSKRTKILFLCTGNSCRSQMAEGWTRILKEKEIEAYSAGVAPKGVDPLAVRAMAESGVDISGQSSKGVEEFWDVEFDYVVTLCGHAQESCPVFPAKTRLVHVGFDAGKIDEIRMLATKAPQLIPYLPPKIAIFAEGEQTVLVTVSPDVYAGIAGDAVDPLFFKRWDSDLQSILHDVATAR